jgi:hypothetical protein
MIKNSILALAASLTFSAPAAASVISYTSQSAFLAGTGATIAEDFESVPDFQRDTGLPSLTRTNFTFAPLAFDLVVASAGYNNFAAGVSPTTSRVLTSNGDENFQGTLSMAAPQGALGLTLLLNDSGPATLDIYNGALLLHHFSYDIASANIVFAGIRSTTAITHFVFASTGGGVANTGIDDLYTANLTAVPEPASWAMLLTGFAGIGIAARRAARKAVAA